MMRKMKENPHENKNVSPYTMEGYLYVQEKRKYCCLEVTELLSGLPFRRRLKCKVGALALQNIMVHVKWQEVTGESRGGGKSC